MAPQKILSKSSMIMWKLSVVLLCFAMLLSSSEQALEKKLSLAERWQQMSDLSHLGPVISLDLERFKSLVRGAPRNYSTIVLFTALDPQHGCDVCHEAYDEFLITARSHSYSKSSPDNVFFTVVDFDKAPGAFELMKVDFAPVFFHFSAEENAKPVMMEAERTGFPAEVIAGWVKAMTDVQIRVVRPPNYAAAAGVLLLLALFGTLLYLGRHNLGRLPRGDTVLAVMALLFTFAVTSGQMWNRIRGPPFKQPSRIAVKSFISGGSRSQLVAETYIIVILSALSVSGMILMIEAANVCRSDVKRRRIMTVVGLAMLAVFFNLVLSIFRYKNGGYPYGFLLL